jgi:hypothetical protein
MVEKYVAHHSNIDDGTGEMGLTEAGRFYYDSSKKKFSYLNIEIDLNKNIFLNKLEKYNIDKEKLIEQMNNGDPILIKNNIYVKKIETSQFRIDLFF